MDALWHFVNAFRGVCEFIQGKVCSLQMSTFWKKQDKFQCYVWICAQKFKWIQKYTTYYTPCLSGMVFQLNMRLLHIIIIISTNSFLAMELWSDLTFQNSEFNTSKTLIATFKGVVVLCKCQLLFAFSILPSAYKLHFLPTSIIFICLIPVSLFLRL